ncbi:MAG: 50S ribosomal protein L4 [Bacteroidetes bacterium GWF2_38_335]|nr:MAG: 50S ribosomal protein L4 [Bacteroidetes bacterium GWF2_38_335]OFY81377.1 MAG: 50S ribosomal protein L4 [Bacteroidetes bacterium RIFOXYA12_FULL_38_20]HBS85500.1 50S ribosomal protein L4 [Bacteroidales bacterium]
MKANVFNISGADTGKKVDLEKAVFEIEPNDHAIYLDVKQIMANNRQGTHKSKERAEINATTKKLKRQKGTGGARAGSMKSPVFVGGGRVFGPQPRDYSQKLNKKVKQLARKSALTYKMTDKAIMVIEDFNLEKPKTNELIKIIDNLKISDKKTLFVLNEQNKNLYLSSRNLEKVHVVTASRLNTYDILDASVLVLAESSVEVLNKF